MAGYTVLSSNSSIQVLSPTLVLDTVTTTIQTQPSGVVAAYWLAKVDFDAGTADTLLATFASNIETIMSGGKVIAASGAESVDANGLIQQTVNFVVAYTPPGSLTGPLTVEVEVPTGDLGGTTELGANYGLQDAEKIIDDAYANLVKLAGG